jgi:phosphatidylcholine synthase
MDTENLNVQTNQQKSEAILAWCVHLLTASGAVFGLLSIIAITGEQWMEAFIWMAIAIAVDSFDGALARRFRVKQVLPNFDGALLDNIVDYLNYVIVPAYFLYGAALLPQEFAIIGAAVTVLVSAYQFCQVDAKTDDHYFKGFPSYWNIAVFYLFILKLSPWLNLILIIFLSILVFVPIKYVYPSRTESNQRLTLFLGMIWVVSSLAIIAQYPEPHPMVIGISLLYIAYYIGLSLHYTDKEDLVKSAARRLNSIKP